MLGSVRGKYKNGRSEISGAVVLTTYIYIYIYIYMPG